MRGWRWTVSTGFARVGGSANRRGLLSVSDRYRYRFRKMEL